MSHSVDLVLLVSVYPIGKDSSSKASLFRSLFPQYSRPSNLSAQRSPHRPFSFKPKGEDALKVDDDAPKVINIDDDERGTAIDGEDRVMTGSEGHLLELCKSLVRREDADPGYSLTGRDIDALEERLLSLVAGDGDDDEGAHPLELDDGHDEGRAVTVEHEGGEARSKVAAGAAAKKNRRAPQGHPDDSAFAPEEAGLDEIGVSEGTTALHSACKRGFGTVVSLLLSSGADPYARDLGGWSPLAYAAWSQRLEIIKNVAGAIARTKPAITDAKSTDAVQKLPLFPPPKKKKN